ncbi:MAG: S1 RNA-binding domain-containing protein [Candidatus Nealsonbacteria bacterium]|nr:MAG: S1 RNA-binding domain-containing protein [Candidatus Nealsonbacteria bacterium]
MKELLEKNNFLKPAKIGDIIEGTVVGKGRSSIFLDLGAIGTGKIYGREFYQAKEKLKNLKIGDKIFSKIIELDAEEGFIELSVSGAFRELSFESLREKKEKGELIKIRILGANKGGLISEISGISAFLPVSQLASEHYPKVEGGDKAKILKELQEFIGQELDVKILDLFPEKEQIILSEKAKDLDKIKEILKSYKIGDVVKGEITGITNFGAFIKFPLSSKSSAKEKASSKKEQLEGLIHISELDWKIIEDPAETVKVGDKVKAKILDISNGKVSLSLKALKKDPWKGIEKKYKKGEIIKGKVTKLNPFGAFIQIDKEIQALCHVSEFEGEKMVDVLEIEKKYKFQILSIDEKEHRMSLKLIKDK